MGKYEDQLAAIGAGADWNIEKIQTLSLALGTLQRTMATLAASPGWEGASADDASEVFQVLKKKFSVVQDAVSQIETTVARANSARSDAASSSSDLPSARIDPFWRTAVTAGSTVVHPVLGPLASDTALDVIEGFLGNQREDAAKKKVESLGGTLEEHRVELQKSQETLRGVPTISLTDVSIPKDDGPTGPTIPGGGYPGGGYPGGGHPGGGYPGGSNPGSNPGGQVGTFIGTPDYTSTDPTPTTPNEPTWVDPTPGGPGGEYPDPTPGPDLSTPSVDDGGPGYIPGGGAGGPGYTPGGGAGTPGGLGGSAGNGSGGSSPIGSGVIGGGAGAALLAGSKLAGAGAGGLGGLGGFGGAGGAGGIGGPGGTGSAAGVRSSGGLLGQAGGAGGGANGANGSSAARAGGASGAAGGRPGMMAGGQQGGASEEKAKGQGLGGYIAPTLDDDDESGPRSKGAGAGGRG